MFSVPQARAAKLRLNEINHKIAYMTKVIDNVTRSEQSYLNHKLLTVKLKKLKLQALAAYAKTQEMNTLLAEIDSLVVENELCAEIDSIKNCKQFQKSEKSMLIKKYGKTRDSPIMTTDYSALSTPNGATDTVPHAHETPESTQDSTNNIFGCYYKVVEKASLLINSITTKPVEDDVQPVVENRPFCKDSETKLNQSTYQEKTNDARSETEYIPLETKAEASTSNATKKEHKNKSSQNSKRHKSRKVNDSVTAASIDLDQCISIDVTHEDTTKRDSVEDILETNASRDNIAYLLSHKKIYSPEISTMNNVESPQSTDLHTSDRINNGDAHEYSEKSHKVNANANKCYEKVTEISKMPRSKSSSKTTQMSHSSKKSHNSSKSSRNINDSRDHKSTKTKHSSTKRNHETDKEKKPHSSKRCKKTHHSEKITKDKSQHATSSTNPDKTIEPQLSNDMKDDISKESALTILTESIKRVMEGKAINICYQEEIVNRLWQDLWAAKQASYELSSSSERTFNCTQCGQDVSEDHMCSYIIRESPEQC